MGAPPGSPIKNEEMGMFLSCPSKGGTGDKSGSKFSGMTMMDGMVCGFQAGCLLLQLGHQW